MSFCLKNGMIQCAFVQRLLQQTKSVLSKRITGLMVSEQTSGHIGCQITKKMKISGLEIFSTTHVVISNPWILPWRSLLLNYHVIKLLQVSSMKLRKSCHFHSLACRFPTVSRIHSAIRTHEFALYTHLLSSKSWSFSSFPDSIVS